MQADCGMHHTALVHRGRLDFGRVYRKYRSALLWNIIELLLEICLSYKDHTTVKRTIFHDSKLYDLCKTVVSFRSMIWKGTDWRPWSNEIASLLKGHHLSIDWTRYLSQARLSSTWSLYLSLAATNTYTCYPYIKTMSTIVCVLT